MRSFLKTGSRCLIVLVLLSLTGCKTATIPAFEPLPVPHGLKANQVEVSILAALANTPIPPELSAGADIADLAISAFFTGNQSVRKRQDWFPESRKPGEIIAAMSHRAHYLQVKIEYDTSTIRLGISNSRHLSQSETRIHKNAIQWVEQLDARLRRSLGFMSAYGNAGSTGSWDLKAHSDVFPVFMPPTVKRVSRIAVLSISESYGTDVPAQLDYIIGFIRALRPKIIFVERESLQKAAEELHLQYSGSMDDETTKGVGKMVGADTLLLYRIHPLDAATIKLVMSSGGTISSGLDVSLIQVETGVSLFRQSVTAKTLLPTPAKGASWPEERIARAHKIGSEGAAAHAFAALAASLEANPLGLVPAVDEVGYVVGLLSAGPAEAAGIKVGDKIVSVNEHPYRSWTDRIDLPANVTVLRDGKETKLAVQTQQR